MVVLRAVIFLIVFAVATEVRPSCADQTGYGIVYVSGKSGTNTGSCGLSAPCANLNYALSVLRTGGTVICLDPTETVSALLITSSVTIQCTGAVYGTISINLPSSDSKQTVHISGLTVNEIYLLDNAILIYAAGNVVLQNMVIEGTNSAAVKDLRALAGNLEIKNTVINKNAGPGLVVAGPAGNLATLDNVTLSAKAYGIAVAAGNRVAITRSTISGNTTAGVEADGGSFVAVNGSTINGNNVGIQSGSAVRLSNNDILFNTTAVSGATGTFGNNRFSGNGTDGTALSPVGGSSTDLAQK